MAAALPSGFLWPIEQLFDPPALVARERPRLDDHHLVAGLVLVLLVVRLELGPLGQVLAVLAVGHPALDQHHPGLVHLVAGDDADHLALARDFASGFIRSSGGGLVFGGHGLLLLFRLGGLRSGSPALLPLHQHGVDLGDVTPGVADQHRVLELVGGALQAVLEQIVLQLGQRALQLLGLVSAEVLGLYAFHMISCRGRTRVFTASLCSARWNASRASCSVTPSSSYITRPGRTTATHSSGAPLPLPMRVSAGFLEMGLSGKMRMYSLPPRLT